MIYCTDNFQHEHHHHHQFLTSWRRLFGGDGYERMTSIVLGPLSILLPSMKVQLILCPHLFCLLIVTWVCLCFFFLRILHV